MPEENTHGNPTETTVENNAAEFLSDEAMLSEQAALLHKFFVYAINESMQAADVKEKQAFGNMALKAQSQCRQLIAAKAKTRDEGGLAAGQDFMKIPSGRVLVPRDMVVKQIKTMVRNEILHQVPFIQETRRKSYESDIPASLGVNHVIEPELQPA